MRFIGRSIPIKRLRFAEPLESEFIEFYNEKIIGHLRAAALVGTALYLLFGLNDIVVHPQYREPLLCIRYVFVSPVLIGVIVYLFKGKSGFLRYALFVIAMIVAGVGISSVVFITADPGQFYYSGLILLIIFNYAVSGLRLKYSTIASLAITLLFFVLSIFFNTLSSRAVFNDIFGLFSVNIMGIFAGYLMENARRKEFLYKKQIEKDKKALEDANVQLRYLSYHDPLTGIYNRRAFNEHLKKEWHRAKRYRYPLSVLMMDIDDFKKYNDSRGHIEGDNVLKEIASVLRCIVNRPGDIVARYGGEEFAVLLAGTDKDGAIYLAEELLNRVRQLRILHPATDRGIVTISIGCTTVVPDLQDEPTAFLRRADEALYRAKKEGKDRVRCFSQAKSVQK